MVTPTLINMVRVVEPEAAAPTRGPIRPPARSGGVVGALSGRSEAAESSDGRPVRVVGRWRVVWVKSSLPRASWRAGGRNECGGGGTRRGRAASGAGAGGHGQRPEPPWRTSPRAHMVICPTFD